MSRLMAFVVACGFVCGCATTVKPKYKKKKKKKEVAPEISFDDPDDYTFGTPADYASEHYHQGIDARYSTGGKTGR